MLERSNLHKAQEALGSMSQPEVTEVVRRRLERLDTQVFPPLRDGYKNLSSRMVDLATQRYSGSGEIALRLKTACVTIADEWSQQTDKQIQANSAPVAELLHLIGVIKATGAIASVAGFAKRDTLAEIRSPWHQDLQEVSLRSLAQLLDAKVSEREPHRQLFEKALKRVDHAPIGLVALARFFPEETPYFAARARCLQDHQLDGFILRLPFWTAEEFGASAKTLARVGRIT
ncbi:hypothetical protein HY025_01045 [Candidatus Daviesbacteria bacterium]|nr:hypothetical protein [Candidatus Daviesbacteria bacterium]